MRLPSREVLACGDVMEELDDGEGSGMQLFHVSEVLDYLGKKLDRYFV